eukprot:TRINITY_DN3799_c0_g1_i3.p1 TRINITY_DN3799_c0_g1~~TRINITY_DN3799_c0_g1_i3.p1  ORF type:complete len:125 (-),score=27.23 TRINITY_DN3799_c0_g1_i3:227-580(-)
MIRRPPRSTLDRSSAASDVYKRQGINAEYMGEIIVAEVVPIKVFVLLESEGAVLVEEPVHHGLSWAALEVHDQRRRRVLVPRLEEDIVKLSIVSIFAQAHEAGVIDLITEGVAEHDA